VVIVCGRLIEPQTIGVQFDQEVGGITTGPGILPASLHNHGPTDEFILKATNNLGLPIVVTPESVHVANGASIDVDVYIDIPTITTGVLAVTIRLTATGASNSSTGNYGEAARRLERTESVFIDGFDEVDVEELLP